MTALYWIPEHIRICPTRAGAVILDLMRNRYFAVGKKAAQVLLAGGTSAQPHNALQPDSDLLDRLVGAGLLSRLPPSCSLLHENIDRVAVLTSVGYEYCEHAGIRPNYFLHFACACAWANWVIRYRTLYAIARELSSAKRVSRYPFNPTLANELVSVFRRIRMLTFYPKNKCLFAALALIKFLAYYQIHPTWVIGVRMRPWSAHSWVQEGSFLLDCNPELVCEYEPMLAV